MSLTERIARRDSHVQFTRSLPCYSVFIDMYSMSLAVNKDTAEKAKVHVWWIETNFRRRRRAEAGLPTRLAILLGTPLYGLYGYVPPQRIWFSSRFYVKVGLDFDQFCLKSGIVFKATMPGTCVFNFT